MNLLDNIEILKGSSGRMMGTGTTAHIDGIPINMADAEGCLFLVLGNTGFGQEATTHFTMAIKGSNTSSTEWSSTAYSFLGSSETVIYTTQILGADVGFDYKMFAVDCYKPLTKYVKATVKEATGTFEVIAIKYGLRRMGTTSMWRDSTWFGGTTRLISPTT